MNDANILPADGPHCFDSKDCLNILVNSTGDDTIRPCPPELLQYMLAERARFERLRAEAENGKKDRS